MLYSQEIGITGCLKKERSKMTVIIFHLKVNRNEFNNIVRWGKSQSDNICESILPWNLTYFGFVVLCEIDRWTDRPLFKHDYI